MQKLKSGVKSSQLWQIISPWILAQNFPNFAQSCLNSPKTQINANIYKYIFFEKEKLKKKNPLGVFSQVKIGLKKAIAKWIAFYKRNILRKHPQIAKKWV